MIRLYLSPLIPLVIPTRKDPEGSTYYGSVIEEIFHGMAMKDRPTRGGWKNVSTTKKGGDGKLTYDIVLVELDVDDHAPFLADSRLIPLAEKTEGKLSQQESDIISAELAKKGIAIAKPDSVDQVMTAVRAAMVIDATKASGASAK